MKKFLLYFCGFVIVFFIAPAICTATPKKKTENPSKITKIRGYHVDKHGSHVLL